MSSKRKLTGLDPPPLQREDEEEEEEEDKDAAVTLSAGFVSFFELLDSEQYHDEEDEEYGDGEEDDDTDHHSTVTLSSAVNRMHIDVSSTAESEERDDDVNTRKHVPAHTLTAEMGRSAVVKLEDAPSRVPQIRPPVSVSVSASEIKAAISAQPPRFAPSVGEEHAVYFSQSEITDITRRVSALYTTLRHTQCQVQVHSISDTDLPVHGPNELKEPRIPLLSLRFIERELAVAFSPTRDSSSSPSSSADEDNVFGDEKAPPRQYSPCARGIKCVGITDKWASLYGVSSASPSSSSSSSLSETLQPFPGSILPALFYPEEMDNDNGHVAKSRHRPCFFCLIKEINEAWLMFAVNRLSLYSISFAPFQSFYNTHGTDEFSRAVLRMPGTHVFNGLVAPVLMYIQSKLRWDFDPARKQWRVNIDALKHPPSCSASTSSSLSSSPTSVRYQPGVVLDSTRSSAAVSSKKPLNS